jgi:hypothetical protein
MIPTKRWKLFADMRPGGKMKEFTVKHSLVLFGILLGSLALLLVLRLVFPLDIRLILCAVIVWAGIAGFFAWARPEKPFGFALASSIVGTVGAWAIFLILHALILKDMDADRLLVNHYYLNGLVTLIPFVQAAQIKAARAK